MGLRTESALGSRLQMLPSAASRGTWPIVEGVGIEICSGLCATDGGPAAVAFSDKQPKVPPTGDAQPRSIRRLAQSNEIYCLGFFALAAFAGSLGDQL